MLMIKICKSVGHNLYPGDIILLRLFCTSSAFPFAASSLISEEFIFFGIKLSHGGKIQNNNLRSKNPNLYPTRIASDLHKFFF